MLRRDCGQQAQNLKAISGTGRKTEYKLASQLGFRLNARRVINVFVNSILALTGIAVVLALGILNLSTTQPHGLALGMVGVVFSVVLLGSLTILFTKKPAAGWAVLVVGTLLLYIVGGPHLFTFSLLGFTWAFAKIGCLSTEH